MIYKIKITRSEENPNFEKEVEQINIIDRKMNGYRETYPMPQEEIIKNVLLVELIEDQYKKVKA